MKHVSLFTMAALGVGALMQAADAGGASGAAGEAGTGSGTPGPKKHRLVVAFETSGEADPASLAEDLKDLLEGEDGVKLLAVTLQEEGKPSADLLGAAPVEAGEGATAEGEETESEEELVSGNTKEELLKLAEEEEVEDVDDRHTKPEIAAAIVAKRTSGRNPGDGQK